MKMPFNQVSEYRFEDLDQCTKYRFMELEINELYRILHTLYTDEKTKFRQADEFITNLLFKTLADSFNHKDYFIESSRLVYFRRPGKHELINYMLYHHQPYKIIQRTVGTSPNTIARYRYQPTPIYYPIYDKWEPHHLANWNRVSTLFNLWGMQMINDPKNRQNPDDYNQY